MDMDGFCPLSGQAHGVADVRAFMRDVEAVQEEKGYGAIVRWYLIHPTHRCHTRRKAICSGDTMVF